MGYRPGAAGLAMVAGLLLVIVLAFTVDPAGATDLELFIGRLHPAIVHLPIGVLLLAVVLEIVTRPARFADGGHAVTLALLVGAWTAILASIAGLYLSQGGGYAMATLVWRRGLGIAAAAVAVAAYVLKRTALREARPQSGYAAALLLLLHRHARRRASRWRADPRRGLPDPLHARRLAFDRRAAAEILHRPPGSGSARGGDRLRSVDRTDTQRSLRRLPQRHGPARRAAARLARRHPQGAVKTARRWWRVAPMRASWCGVYGYRPNTTITCRLQSDHSRALRRPS